MTSADHAQAWWLYKPQWACAVQRGALLRGAYVALWKTLFDERGSRGGFIEFPSTLGYTTPPHWTIPLITLRTLNLAIFCKKGQKAVLYIEDYYRYTRLKNKEGIYTFKGQSAQRSVTMGWRPGDPRPRPDADVPGYAPRPRGETTPKPLDVTRGAPGLKPKWSPRYGWRPAAYQIPSVRATIFGARAQAEAAGGALKEALRNTARTSLGPLMGGGGGNNPNSNKKK